MSSREKSLGMIAKLFSKRIESHFHNLLVGKTIESREGILVSSDIRTSIKIGEFKYPMHFRWTNEEEEEEGEEIVEIGSLTLEQYFEKIKGKKIQEVNFTTVVREFELVYELDGELYLECQLGDKEFVLIPMGYFSDSEQKFYGFLDEVLSEEEKECYKMLMSIIGSLKMYVIKSRASNDKVRFREGVYQELLETLGKEKEFKYEFWDFYKIDKIQKIIDKDFKDVIQVISEVENVIFES